MKFIYLFLLLVVLAPSLAKAEWCPPIPHAPCFGPPNNPPPPNDPPPPPPPGYGYYCEDSSFVGTYSDGRSANLRLQGNGPRLNGTLFLQRPNDRWNFRADCRELNGYADVLITFQNGVRHHAEIYEASDYRVYLEGEDERGRRFVLQRR